MSNLGWDGCVINIIGTTRYYQGAGNICIGTSEIKQEELIRKAFNDKMSKDIGVSIFWD